MRLRQKLAGAIGRTAVGRRLVLEPRFRAVATAGLTFGLHLLYAVYHGALGAAGHSVWLLALCVYYVVLAAMRLAVIACALRNREAPDEQTEYFVMGLCGLGLMTLSVVLAGINYVSLARHMAARRGEIMMIAIAAYTFTKLGMVIARAVRHKRDPSPLLAVLRTISYAEIAASVLTLQRSMLVSFGEMETGKIHTMNALTGSGVFLFVLALGAALIHRGRKQKGK